MDGDMEHAGVVDRDALKRYCDRTVQLRAERRETNEALGAVMKEAKAAGFVPEMIRGIVREMEMEDDARDTFYTTQAAYRRALDLGHFADTPLGEATIQREAAVKPRPFAEQPVHNPKRRGRPRKSAAERTEEHLANARRHLGFENIAAGDI